MRNDQVPHLTLSKPLIGGSHMLSQEIPTSNKLVSMALILTVVFDGGALSDGVGLAAMVVSLLNIMLDQSLRAGLLQ